VRLKKERLSKDFRIYNMDSIAKTPFFTKIRVLLKVYPVSPNN